MSKDPYENDDLLLADGWEDCFVGVASTFTRDGIRHVAVYDYPKMIDKIIKEESKECADNCECDHYGDAAEYLQFNVLGAYVGPNTPIYLSPCTLEEAQEEIEMLR
jgi:hypothetical protein